MTSKLSRISSAAGIAAAVALVWAAPVDARVTKVLVDQAINSNVCNQPGDFGKCNPAAP